MPSQPNKKINDGSLNTIVDFNCRMQVQCFTFLCNELNYLAFRSTILGIEVVSGLGLRLVSVFLFGTVSLITWSILRLMRCFPVPAEVAIMEEITHMPAKATNKTFFILINLSFTIFLRPGQRVYYPDKRNLQKSDQYMGCKNHASFILLF